MRLDQALRDHRQVAAPADLPSSECPMLDDRTMRSKARGLDWALHLRTRFNGALRARMAGPGGYYNLGNLLGLVMSVAVQLAAPHGAHGGAALIDYFAGSGGAVALTLATCVFLWSGEVYHRAWARSDAPIPRLNRLGDLLSGVGSIGLGWALFLFGQPLLAVTSGLLSALGKFGSAVHKPGAALPGWPVAWPDPFRSAVLLSRVPAALAAFLSLAAALRQVWAGAPASLVVTPLTLLACYALWARADLLLFAGDAGALESNESSGGRVMCGTTSEGDGSTSAGRLRWQGEGTSIVDDGDRQMGVARYVCVAQPDGFWMVWDNEKDHLASIGDKPLFGLSKLRAEASCGILQRIETGSMTPRTRPYD